MNEIPAQKRRTIVSVSQCTLAMRGMFFVLLLIMGHGLSLKAQPTSIPEVDSLQKILATPLTDSARAIVMAELAYRYYVIPDSTYQIATRGLALSKRIGFEGGVAANQYSLAAGYYSHISEFEESMDLLSKAFKYELQHGNKRNIARCYLSLGFTLAAQGEIEEGIANTKKGFKLFEEIKDTDGVMLTANNLGYLLMKQEKYDSAEYFLQQGLDLALKSKTATRIAELSGSIAELYLKKGELEKAFKLLSEAIEFNVALDMRLQSFNKTLLAKLHLANQDTKKAELSLREAIRIASDVMATQEVSDAYALLSQVYSIRGDYESALKYYKQSVDLRNKVLTEKVNRERQLLKHKFESDEREARITILEQEKILQERMLAEASYERQLSTIRFWMLVLLIVLLLAVVALFAITQRARIRRERFRLWKREQILANEFEVRLANSELIALKAQMNPHFIFNSLNSINRYIIKSDPVTASDYLTRFSKLIRLILENSMTLKVPLENEIQAVELYLQMEAMRFEKKFTYNIHISPNVSLSSIEVFPLIMQPYVENAIWHGLMHKTNGDGRIQIRVELDDGFLVYTIEDNGIGRTKAMEHTQKKWSGKKSFGLQITHDRLKLLARDLNEEASSVSIVDLTDTEGHATGTRVIIRIPIATKWVDEETQLDAEASLTFA